MATPNTASATAGHESAMNAPPERTMTMSEPPSYMATVASSAPHANANAMEQGLADTTPIRQLQSESAMIICPHCNRRASTRVDTQSTTSTYIVGCLLCLVCIIAAILPCIFGWFDDKHHYCSECGKEVAVRHSNGEITVKKPEGIKNFGNPVSGAGNSYPMVNMGGGPNGGNGHAQQGFQQPQPQQRREEPQAQGRQDEQISSFLSTNAPREETPPAPPAKN